MTKRRLDRLDVEILRLMLTDRHGYKEVARMLNVSDRTVLRHIEHLKEIGVFEGLVPKLNLSLLPKEVREELGVSEYVMLPIKEIVALMEAFDSILGQGFNAIIYHAGRMVGEGIYERLSTIYENDVLLPELGRELTKRGLVKARVEGLDLEDGKGRIRLIPLLPREVVERDGFIWLVKGVIQGFLERSLGRIRLEFEREGDGYVVRFERRG